MISHIYQTYKIGDGKTTETAFRPYLPIEGLECTVIGDIVDGKTLIEINEEEEIHDLIMLEKDIDIKEE
jgi:hypothetical protein